MDVAGRAVQVDDRAEQGRHRNARYFSIGAGGTGPGARDCARIGLIVDCSYTVVGLLSWRTAVNAARLALRDYVRARLPGTLLSERVGSPSSTQVMGEARESGTDQIVPSLATACHRATAGV